VPEQRGIIETVSDRLPLSKATPITLGVAILVMLALCGFVWKLGEKWTETNTRLATLETILLSVDKRVERLENQGDVAVSNGTRITILEARCQDKEAKFIDLEHRVNTLEGYHKK
jgi:hypothetical protein